MLGRDVRVLCEKDLSMFQHFHSLKTCAQRGARTHDPEIKSLMLYRLSQPGSTCRCKSVTFAARCPICRCHRQMRGWIISSHVRNSPKPPPHHVDPLSSWVMWAFSFKSQGTAGVEPATSRSAVECSATELYPHPFHNSRDHQQSIES